MFQLPPIPSWDALHPLVVHFPIALLLVTPLFVLMGVLCSPPNRRSYLVAALVLMLLGTVSVFVAVETGETAGKFAPATPEVRYVLEQHEDLAEIVEVSFSVLTVIFAAILFAPKLLHWDISRPWFTALLLLFLVLYGAACVVLANTSHAGGRLVHELGVRSKVVRY